MTKLPLRINAFVYREHEGKKEFLCIKRIPSDGGFWQTVTGTVHDDESLQGTIVREIQEECGIRAEDILYMNGPLYDFEWMKGEIKIREFVYVVLVKDNLTVTLSPEEHDDYRWCSETALFETLEKEQNIIAGKKVLAQLHA